MFIVMLSTLLALCITALPLHDTSLQAPLSVKDDANSKSEDYNLDPIGTYAFAGLPTFDQLPSRKCLNTTGPLDDILVVGLPFDTATSYRTGARMGPNAIRRGSAAASLW